MSIESSTTGSAPVEGAESVAPAAEVQNAPDISPAQETDGSPDPGGSAVIPPAAAAAPTYTPNYKYKAALQEKELDAFWRPLVKDADSEKKVKEAFSKIDAFDVVKQDRDSLKQQFQSVSGDFQNVVGTVQRFNESIKNDDLSSAFRLANVPKEKVFQWVKRELERAEMPPEQRQQFEQYEQAQMQKYELEQRFQQLQQQHDHQATQTRVMQLDAALSRPEVSKFAEQWDQRTGNQGGFKFFVIEEAKKAFLSGQGDLSAEDAVRHAMQHFGNLLNAGETAQPPPQVVSQGQAFNNKPVIPNVTGKAISPIKKVPKNLDDLRVLAKEASRQ